MAQIQALMRVIKSQHFWLLSVLVLLIGVASWFMASSTLQEQFETNRTKIQSNFEALRNVRAKSPHPNPEVTKAVEAETKKMRLAVFYAWKTLYERQKNVLVWPNWLRGDFHRMIAGKKFGDFIEPRYCRRYRDYIEQRFEELPDMVDARAIDSHMDGGAMGGMGMDMDEMAFGGGPNMGVDPMAEEEDYTVDWMDYGTIKKEYNWRYEPLTMRVWVAQEDLWVYETLLKIIARANDPSWEQEGAVGLHKAAIKSILSLEVGNYAAGGSDSLAVGRIKFSGKPTAVGGGMEGGMQVAGLASAAGEEEDWGDAVESMYGGLGFDDEGTVDASQIAKKDPRLLNFRYVGKDGSPVEADLKVDLTELTPAKPNMMDELLTTEQVHNQEYKSLPVRLTLQMERRRVPRLIIACANAALPLVVTQVRVNVQDDSISGGYGGSARRPYMGQGGKIRGGGAMGGMGEGMDMDEMMFMGGNKKSGGNAMLGIGRQGRDMGSSSYGMSGGGGDFDDMGGGMSGVGGGMGYDPTIAKVIIQGNIYIYNPPNPDTLKLEDEDLKPSDADQT